MFNVLISIALSLSFFQTEIKLEPDPNKPLGEVIPIEEAAAEFQKRYDKKVMIPKYIPFTPTIAGGKVSENEITLDYLDEKDNKTLSLSAYVNDLKIKKAKDDFFNLDNGIKAEIINDKRIGFMLITFKADGLSYLIGINKSKYRDTEECIKELTKVANSLE